MSRFWGRNLTPHAIFVASGYLVITPSVPPGQPVCIELGRVDREARENKICGPSVFSFAVYVPLSFPSIVMNGR